ncbi:hypothetical protein [uncultured Shewanella sp.]|uniref:hypothetical protein n=1 Tax=uncultured Shewanella sp. TaxID=173975 RepID=UPI00261D2359|nr:hypothetical protein [uncultured Shewanella sp.]
MKILAIIIIVLIGVYLYRRNKTVSTPEATIHDEQSEVDGSSEHLSISSSKEEEAEPSITSLTDGEKKVFKLFVKANERLKKHVDNLNQSEILEEKYTAMIAVIAECYKQRKDKQYVDFCVTLSSDFSRLCERISQDESLLDLKGVSFMQLATLLNDKGDFDEAISICQQAIDYELTDGTVSGFSGRKSRIEKAKHKQAR